jgi:hypothetical protein
MNISSAIGFHLPADGLVPVCTPGTFLFSSAELTVRSVIFFRNFKLSPTVANWL